MQTLRVSDSGNEGGHGGDVLSCVYGNDGTGVGGEEVPLPVEATPSFKPKSGVITRFLGKHKVERTYLYTCPACGYRGEIASLPSESIRCTSCNRLLQVSAEGPQLQTQMIGLHPSLRFGTAYFFLGGGPPSITLNGRCHAREKPCLAYTTTGRGCATA